jgi:hypothetical protein
LADPMETWELRNSSWPSSAERQERLDNAPPLRASVLPASVIAESARRVRACPASGSSPLRSCSAFGRSATCRSPLYGTRVPRALNLQGATRADAGSQAAGPHGVGSRDVGSRGAASRGAGARWSALHAPAPEDGFEQSAHDRVDAILSAAAPRQESDTETDRPDQSRVHLPGGLGGCTSIQSPQLRFTWNHFQDFVSS